MIRRPAKKNILRTRRRVSGHARSGKPPAPEQPSAARKRDCARLVVLDQADRPDLDPGVAVVKRPVPGQARRSRRTLDPAGLVGRHCRHRAREATRPFRS